MELNEVPFDGLKPIEGYGPGFFRIGGAVHEGAVVVLPGGVSEWGGYGDTATLIRAKGDVDVVLVGTGREIAQVPRAFREALEEAGLGVEVMGSAAACRTYNVLLGEGRRIAAAMLPAG
ncbi:uncharacterized protein LX81_01317 [Palleronia aestuarii]|uniref:Mth938-like domain-containing protein n=1 Tax=Palleronia aestuarii TaxID=568105 RepID=A0A2W7P2C5_9RHOB|nr:Mth938-like domain-containing protein [Palleronia aestuarii]PZX17592.1 uncharacterized protein LX81_01317 [Palleronia aestuarii]